SAGSEISRREFYIPVTRLGVAPDSLVPTVSRWLKIICCKSAVADGNGLFLGQVPVIHGPLRGAASQSRGDDEHEKAQHRPNETKTSDGGRDRTSIGVEVWKSSQKWSAQPRTLSGFAPL